jgi:hypothetical protein
MNGLGADQLLGLALRNDSAAPSWVSHRITSRAQHESMSALLAGEEFAFKLGRNRKGAA